MRKLLFYYLFYFLSLSNLYYCRILTAIALHGAGEPSPFDADLDAADTSLKEAGESFQQIPEADRPAVIIGNLARMREELDIVQTQLACPQLHAAFVGATEAFCGAGLRGLFMLLISHAVTGMLFVMVRACSGGGGRGGTPHLIPLLLDHGMTVLRWLLPALPTRSLVIPCESTAANIGTSVARISHLPA